MPRTMGTDYEPTGQPASTKDIIATGGDFVGAASIFLNPPIRFLGSFWNTYKTITDMEYSGRNYAAEADAEAKEAMKKAGEAGKDGEAEEFERKRDMEDNLFRHQIAGMDMVLLLKEKELRSRKRKDDKKPFNFYISPKIEGSEVNFEPDIDNSSRSYGGRLRIINESYNKGASVFSEMEAARRRVMKKKPNYIV